MVRVRRGHLALRRARRFTEPVRFYGVRSAFLEGDPLGDVIELFLSRDEAEEVVAAWDRDEPEEAGLLEVVEVTLALSMK